jgi:two-component system, chemotaxis family, CheB/CheR fusion protein
MSTQRPEYIVGIGASAGGLEALERFFDNVPPKTGMAFVLVQHLSPDFKSLMDELLARHTELPIRLVEDGMVVEADHVYLIPPKKEMIVSGGRLLLSERDRQQELSLPIDVFFRSLAQDCGKRAIAVVLSGGGSDGSRGIRDVHDAGGLVIVQDVESAQFDGMPKTARDVGVAHWVLRPEEMPHVIVEHGAALTARSVPGAVDITPLEPQGLEGVYRMLQEEFGIDFTHYKPSTVTRRIERRLQLARADDLQEYVRRLRSDRDELDVLYRDLLIGVTRFFRNGEAFEVLENRILPDLFQKIPKDAPLRVWVAGCATGEEAYSLAILLHELSARHGNRPVKIFATDVHRGSLEIASRALYEEDAVANVSPERLERYFWHRGKTFQVVPDIRQMIVFAPHNVIRDAPFTRVDLISCRNLLIYLQPPAQQKALSLFHFALNRGGVVFLGPSESPGALLHDFETVDRHWKIYRKYSDVRIPVDTRLQPRTEPRLGPAAIFVTQTRASLPALIGTYDKLLDEYMPPSLLVTDRGELVHAFGGASKFLELRDGRPLLDVREVVQDELKVVLVGGLQRAVKSEAGVVFKGIRVGTEEPRLYDIRIRRVRTHAGGSVHLLVSFEEVGGRAATRTAPTEIELNDVSRDQLGALESELLLTKENLQAAIEELQTSNEELQAANEELLASNEELQSTNEELQSVNEELYTVNAEYQRKIAELTELTNDMDNLLSSTDIGTVFLDRNLAIRKFTPRIAQAFDLLPQDVGRPIATFASNFAYPGLVEDLKKVLENGTPIERELRDKGAHVYFMRLLPYRAKGAVDGVVLTLIDVSGLKKAEDALFHERYLLNSLLFSVRDAIYFKDAKGRFIRANPALAERFGLRDPAAAVGRTAFELSASDDVLALQQQDEIVLRTGRAEHGRLEKRQRADGRVGWDLVTRLPMRDSDGAIVGLTCILRDVTEQVEADEKIQQAVRRRDQFLAMLSHELRNPLGAIVTATELMGEGQVEPPRHERLLGILRRQSSQMARLLDDLLEVSRVTQNKIELRKQAVDVGSVTRDAADVVRSLMDSRGVSFDVKIEPGALVVDGDPARIQQIQVNLLNNAAKYTPRGGHVSLETKREGSDVVITVKDDGMGIPKDLLESVFELFVQSHRTLDRAEGGIGVGLTLVRSLVTMHGGTVTATSDGEGRGSTFVVRIPLADKPEVGVPSGAVRSLKLPDRARIVIVEDNVDSCQMLCELLSVAGFECEPAHDGVAGAELIARARPDVAIVDVGLPGLDGFEVARRIRANPATARTYLVALTGYGQPADRAQAREAGFDEHIVKPVHPDRLLAMLGRERTQFLVRHESGPLSGERMVDGAPPRVDVTEAEE